MNIIVAAKLKLNCSLTKALLDAFLFPKEKCFCILKFLLLSIPAQIWKSEYKIYQSKTCNQDLVLSIEDYLQKEIEDEVDKIFHPLFIAQSGFTKTIFIAILIHAELFSYLIRT
jgi:hypothetical protein